MKNRIFRNYLYDNHPSIIISCAVRSSKKRYQSQPDDFNDLELNIGNTINYSIFIGKPAYITSRRFAYAKAIILKR